MTALGFNKPLYILPFDHRAHSRKKCSDGTNEIVGAKRVIYDAFKNAIEAGVPKERAGILVDEQFGAEILRDASAEGYVTACPAEKSGQDEFDFEYGNEFALHIESFHPTFSKVLVRYNPEGDKELNRRQALRLRRLSEYLHTLRSRSRLMFELQVPSEQAQLDRVGGNKRAYDLKRRPGFTVQAIEELQAAGVEPDVWKCRC